MPPLPADDRPLRIVHTESSCGWGGQEIRILTESQGMLGRGHQVRLVCPAEAPIYAAAQARGIPVEPLPIERRNWRAFWAVRRWLASQQADVVNTHSSTDSWLFSLVSKLVRTRTRVVRTRHISCPVSQDPWTRWLYARGARMVVTCGEAIRRQLIEGQRLEPDQVVSVPTGIDTTRFVPGDRREARRRLHLPEEGHIVGIVAMLRGGKGHLYLLDALHRLNRDGLRLVIVGDGTFRESIEARIRELDLGDRVLLAGRQEDVVPWLQAMDVFSLPSIGTDGVPQSVMQAMSCGLPVVSTTYGAIGEAVAHNVTGLLVPPKDSQALAEAIDTLLRDESLRARFGAAGRQQALSRFTVDHMLDRMEQVFRRVAA